MGVVHIWTCLGQPKVGNLSNPLIIQQNIGGFDVAVNDGFLYACVQVVQPAGSTNADLKAPLP
jgi:hypothetical protein